MSDQDYIDMKSGFVPHYRKAEVPYEEIRDAQEKVINSIAEKGNCVIVGRGADYILRERDDAFHVFIHASMEHRVKRVQRHEGVTDQAERIQKELEQKRPLKSHIPPVFYTAGVGKSRELYPLA